MLKISPKGIFELLNSENYKERFIGEFYELHLRYTKLANLLQKDDTKTLEFELTNREILDMQKDTMSNYLRILKIRAKLENINLYDNSLCEKGVDNNE